MATQYEIENRISAIEKRNDKVALDKAWETSWARRGLLALFTYVSVGAYLAAIKVDQPWLNAIVPTLAFLLSTLTMPFFRKIWEGNRQKK
jgi:hypothetical protein